MKIFLDTSSLFKLYHYEVGTLELDNLFNNNKITEIYLSEITKVEFASIVWKKVRTKEIVLSKAIKLLSPFKSNFDSYIFINTNSNIINYSEVLLSKYGIQGLRTLDSIQLSTSIILKNKIDLYHTSDKLLQYLYKEEELPQ